MGVLSGEQNEVYRKIGRMVLVALRRVDGFGGSRRRFGNRRPYRYRRLRRRDDYYGSGPRRRRKFRRKNYALARMELYRRNRIVSAFPVQG